MSDFAQFRGQAEVLATTFPALLAQAQQLSASLHLGAHRRRQAGQGDEFWQYRPAFSGDSARAIDWRRSARSDGHFIREKEWQSTQSVWIWCDDGASMRFSGSKNRPTKAQYGQVLLLALTILALRGGEKVGVLGNAAPRAGRVQIERLGLELLAQHSPQQDYGSAPPIVDARHGVAVFCSDFLAPIGAVERSLRQAANQGLRGVILQILDPVEETFPFAGRMVFETASRNLQYETHEASDLRSRYLARLAERKTHLRQLSQELGWHYSAFHTENRPSQALLWLYQALEDGV